MGSQGESRTSAECYCVIGSLFPPMVPQHPTPPFFFSPLPGKVGVIVKQTSIRLYKPASSFVVLHSSYEI